MIQSPVSYQAMLISHAYPLGVNAPWAHTEFLQAVLSLDKGYSLPAESRVRKDTV